MVVRGYVGVRIAFDRAIHARAAGRRPPSIAQQFAGPQTSPELCITPISGKKTDPEIFRAHSAPVRSLNSGLANGC